MTEWNVSEVVKECAQPRQHGGLAHTPVVLVLVKAAVLCEFSTPFGEEVARVRVGTELLVENCIHQSLGHRQ